MFHDDYHRILPRLYQGSAPPTGTGMAEAGFDIIVLCAHEYQFGPEYFPGTRVYNCPFDDDFDVPLERQELQMIKNTAARVVRDLRHGARVYVSCYKGWNRSGLVTAHVVSELLSCSGAEALLWVQARRPRALQNPIFARYLHKLDRPGYGRRQRAQEHQLVDSAAGIVEIDGVEQT